MSYPHRYYLFADAAGAAWVRAVFSQLGDGGEAEADNCRVPLSPAADPAAPPVAWCCSFVATEAQRLTLAGAESAMPAGVTYCRCDATGPTAGTIRATNWPDQSVVGRRFDMAAALAAAGLAFHTKTGGM